MVVQSDFRKETLKAKYPSLEFKSSVSVCTRVEFISGMADWFNIRQSINIIHYISWLKKGKLHNHLSECRKNSQNFSVPDTNEKKKIKFVAN